MIPNIDIDHEKILRLARRYLKDGRINDPVLNKINEPDFKETKSQTKIAQSSIQTTKNILPVNKSPSTDDEEDENVESVIDLINSFKPYYSMNINDDKKSILFRILLFENDKSAIKSVSIKEKNNIYNIYIKGYKNKSNIVDEQSYNIEYGNFYIECELSTSDITLINKKYSISNDNNGYINVTVN